jgi:hypothetical protein
VPGVREILIGRRSGDHALLTVRGRLFPEDDASDWLWTSLAVRVGGFGCQLEGNLRAGELRRFRVALERLHDASATEAALTTEDDWVSIRLVSDGDRSVTGMVLVRDEASPPNELRCGLPDLEPASLPAAIESLHEVERSFTTG